MAGRAPSGGPNFKTDVHRNVTKKWAGARNVAYDGDDWGGYDDYDDAYVEEPPPPMPNAAPAAKPTGLRQRGQVSVRQPESSRNFTAPPTMQPASQATQQPPQQTLHKAGSFDYGDDRRDFSATLPSSPQQQQGRPSQDQYSTVQAMGSRPTSGAVQAPHPSQQSAADRDYYQRRDFSPSAVPQPLSQRSPPATTLPDRSAEQSFPPRKSSLSQRERPDIATVVPNATAPSDAPRPLFVRPADIYKRMEAEREKERQSMDSARPSGASVDTVRPVVSPPTIAEAPTRASYTGPAEMDAGPILTSGTLGDVRSGFGMDGLPIREESASKTTTTPLLPKLDRFSGFGSDMWGATSFTEPSELSSTGDIPQISHSEVSAASDAPLKEQPSMGFRSAVERAFDEQGGSTLSPVGQSTLGSQRSADGSEVSRTDSTAGVSPIISRMSSGATAAMRAQEREDRHEASPAIAEESTSATSDTAGQNTNLAHVRNVSGDSSSGYRRNMEMPSPSNSPARHPALETNQALQPPAQGELAVTTPVDVTSPQEDSGRFQESVAVAVASRTSSPSKGRVADLASKYDTNSRRNSGSSIASWASSKRSASPVKDAAGNGVSAYQTSDALHPPSDPARPHLPGEWVSYDTTTTRQSGTSLSETRTVTQEDRTSQELPATDVDAVPDFSPSKSTEAPSGVAAAGPMAALASAGAAIAASLTQSAGNAGATGERDFANSKDAEPEQTTATRQLSGEVTSRGPLSTHLQPSDAESPATSFAPTPSEALSPIGPTPPPKDTPLTDTINRMSGYFPAPPAPLKGREGTVRAATQPHALQETENANSQLGDEFESDRLNEEIERSLTPGNADSVATNTSNQLAPPSPITTGNAMRESSHIPKEYDSYWNGSEFDERSQPSRGVSGAGVGAAAEKTQGRQLSDTPPVGAISPRAGMLAKRFSWEVDDEPPVAESAAVEPTTAEKIEASKASQEVFQEPSALAEANRRDFGSSDLPSPGVAPAALSTIKMSMDESGKPGSGTLSAALADDSSMTSRTTAAPKKSLDATSSTRNSFSPATAVPATPTLGQKAGWVHPAPLKELMELNPPAARVERCNQIRTQYGTMETGLDGWLAHMIAVHPEHGRAALAAPHLTADTSGGLAGSVRNKISPAMSKFANKATGSSSTPYYQQYLNAAASVNAQAAGSQQSNAASSGPLQDPNFKGRSPSQSKGKDLFGSIGGKASHSAKGLFAKGKQKLRAASTEKASIPPTSSIPTSFSSSSFTQPAPPSSKSNQRSMGRFFRRSSSQGNVLNGIPPNDAKPAGSAAVNVPAVTTTSTTTAAAPSDLHSAAPRSVVAGTSQSEAFALPESHSTNAPPSGDFSTAPAVPVSYDRPMQSMVESDVRDYQETHHAKEHIDAASPTEQDSNLIGHTTVADQSRMSQEQPIQAYVSVLPQAFDGNDARVEAKEDDSDGESFHSAPDKTVRHSSNFDGEILTASATHPTAPAAETHATDSPTADQVPHEEVSTAHLTSDVTGVDNATHGAASEPQSILPSTRDTSDLDVTTAEPVVHETILPEVHHVTTESITREIHTYEEIHRVQPISDVEILPTKHYAASPTDGKLVEIADPGHDGAIPVEVDSSRPRSTSTHEPVVISQRDGPADSPASRPFANAHDDYERPKSSPSTRSRSRSSPAPVLELSAPPVPSSPPRPVLVSSPSEDIAFARATTNRRPQSEYLPSLHGQARQPVYGQQWYTPSDPASQRYIDARTYDTEYAIPGLGPDLSLPAFDKSKGRTATREESPAKGKRENKVRSIYGKLRSRSRSRSRSGMQDIALSSTSEEPLPPFAAEKARPPSSGPSFFPPQNIARPASGTGPNSMTPLDRSNGAKTPSPTRIDPRLPSQAFTVSPDIDDLEDGRRPSIMHDPDPLPRQTLPRTTKAEEAEYRRTLRRRQEPSNDEAQKQNRRSWFGGMFSSSRPRSSSGNLDQSSFAAPQDTTTQMSQVTPGITGSPGTSRETSGNAASAAAAALAMKSERRPTNRLSKAPSSRPQQPRTRPAANEQSSRMRPTSMYAAMPSTDLSAPGPRQQSSPLSRNELAGAPAISPSTNTEGTYGFPQHPMARETTSYTPTRDPTLPNLAKLPNVSQEAVDEAGESFVHPAHRQSLPPSSGQVDTYNETQIAPPSSPPFASAAQKQRGSSPSGFVTSQPPRGREEYVRYMQAQGFFPDRRSPKGEGPGGSGPSAVPGPSSKRRSPERRYGVPGFDD